MPFVAVGGGWLGGRSSDRGRRGLKGQGLDRCPGECRAESAGGRRWAKACQLGQLAAGSKKGAGCKSALTRTSHWTTWLVSFPWLPWTMRGNQRDARGCPRRKEIKGHVRGPALSRMRRGPIPYSTPCLLADGARQLLLQSGWVLLFLTGIKPEGWLRWPPFPGCDAAIRPQLLSLPTDEPTPHRSLLNLLDHYRPLLKSLAGDPLWDPLILLSFLLFLTPTPA